MVIPRLKYIRTHDDRAMDRVVASGGVAGETITVEGREDPGDDLKVIPDMFAEPASVVGPVGTVGPDVCDGSLDVRPGRTKGDSEGFPFFFRAVIKVSEILLGIGDSEATGELEGVTSIEVDGEI